MAMIRQNSRFDLLEFLFGASSLLTSRLLTWSGPHPGLLYSEQPVAVQYLAPQMAQEAQRFPRGPAPVVMATGREAGSEA